MFRTEIHPQPDRHTFDGNNTHKGATILHNFGSGSILILFPITAL